VLREPTSVDSRASLPIGRYLTLGDLCSCTSTYQRFAQEIQPFPLAPESLDALEQLAAAILDPILGHFGRERFQLTYGFCSHDLRRHLERRNPETGKPFGRICPEVDQHMARELGARSGKPVCAHGGAAVDFRIRDLSSRDLVSWMLERALPFDSLYYYGPDRPVHVSHGPSHRRAVWAFNESNTPTTRGIEDWVRRARELKPR